MTIEILRVIQEISPLQALEKAVDEAAAKVADWRRSVAGIETQLNTANLALVRAKETRQTHALKASLGDDAEAVAQIKHARSEQHSAEQIIGDLQIAHPEALASLAEAEKIAAGARNALAQFMAGQVMKERIALAGQIDSVVADLTQLLVEFEKLGHEIANSPGIMPSNMFGMVSNDDAIGLRRVRASLPKIFDRVFPNAQHDEMKKENLATTEARHWNLPPIESEEKAA